MTLVHKRTQPDALHPDFDKTLARLRQKLLDARTPDGHWTGRLASSALSTATAVIALVLVDKEKHQTLIGRGLAWLTATQNPDGGWGDTDRSLSNISTTMLALAAFSCAGSDSDAGRPTVHACRQWIERYAGGTTPDHLTQAIFKRYGKDLTFSIPILSACALAGMSGPGNQAWSKIKPLPFELAACPHQLFKWLRLPVVSYALPALIALGQVRHYFLPSKNLLARILRNLLRARTLKVLTEIQPDSGGFLEATPLTSFVVMSLAAMQLRRHPVVRQGVRFLEDSVRDDGSWPIDTNLATWVTTLSVNGLAQDPEVDSHFSRADRKAVLDWLLQQQHRQEHAFTHAAPGGWAWTDLSGGVPDADDTPGALLALASLAPHEDAVVQAAQQGISWLVDLQNRDGGMPTFCRGWGTLPFDMSSPDLTAHALKAFAVWWERLPATLQARVEKARKAALAYLRKVQREDGSWVPLWFGNQHTATDENPTYGTSRVLSALAAQWSNDNQQVQDFIMPAVQWLLAAQNKDGGWGGAPGIPASIEETSVALEALAAIVRTETFSPEKCRELQAAIKSGTTWLIENTRCGEVFAPTPIGFYFASLWYYEELYPLIFGLSALNRVKRIGFSQPEALR